MGRTRGNTSQTVVQLSSDPVESDDKPQSLVHVLRQGIFIGTESSREWAVFDERYDARRKLSMQKSIQSNRGVSMHVKQEGMQ